VCVCVGVCVCVCVCVRVCVCGCVSACVCESSGNRPQVCAPHPKQGMPTNKVHTRSSFSLSFSLPLLLPLPLSRLCLSLTLSSPHSSQFLASRLLSPKLRRGLGSRVQGVDFQSISLYVISNMCVCVYVCVLTLSSSSAEGQGVGCLGFQSLSLFICIIVCVCVYVFCFVEHSCRDLGFMLYAMSGFPTPSSYTL